MNQIKHIYRVLAITIPITVGVGIFGATFGSTPANADVLAINSGGGEQQVVDSKSVGPSVQNRLNLNEDSLFYSIDEYDNLFDLKRKLLHLVDEATELELVEIFHESREYPLAFDSIRTTHWLRSVVLFKLLDVDSNAVQTLFEQLDAQTAQVVVYGVMREWNQMHVDEAVNFLALFDRGLQRRGLLGLIDGNTSFNRSNFIEMGVELGFLEDFLTGLIDRHQRVQDQASLDDIATDLENLITNGEYRFYEVLQDASSFVLEEGLDALPRVLELFDEQSVDIMSPTVRMSFDGTQSSLVSDIARSDPELLFEYIVNLGKPLKLDLLSSVCEVWFGRDPETLWSRLEGEDLKYDRHEISEDVIRHWTMGEPNLALVSIDQFPAEYHDLVYAQVALAVAEDSPLQALELLRETSDWSLTRNERADRESNVDSTVGYDFAIERTISAAAKVDPILTIEWIESEESNLDDSMKNGYLSRAFRSWAGSDPSTAFEMALQTPLTANTAGFEATVVGWMARQDVDDAIELLPRVRDGKTKLSAYRRVMFRLEELDRISHALHLGSDLPENEREEYNKALASRVGDREPFDRLIAGLRELPTQELQSKAIRSRLMFAYYVPKMAPKVTNKQLDQLKEFLTDRENRLLEMGRRMYKDLIHEDSPEE
ncbi:MAG: hypothetical protein F4W92_05765 [Gammaproteobacteria bacterium]|nr:hypothetical protein [Gammaproteobacteria bacterium]